MELERLKNARIESLEAQLHLERSRAHQAQQRSQRLKQKYLDMLGAVRDSVFDMSDEDVECASTLQKLTYENRVLRELLAASREGDPDTEGRLPAVPETEYLQVLQQYKQKKSNAQRSKSYSTASKKGYLLSAGKGSSSPQESSWDDFFKAKEKGSRSPEERYDQAEEPK